MVFDVAALLPRVVFQAASGGVEGVADGDVDVFVGVALVMMAMLFMLEERMIQKEDYPLLSCADIENLLARFLPRRDLDKEEVIRQVEASHRRRKRAIESHARMAKKRAKLSG